MENKSNLAKAVIAVMKAVNGIEKNSEVGSGIYTYKGVRDQEVKLIYKKAMAENGLCVFPTGVKSKTRIDRWEDNGKQKQQVFVETKTKYLLLHESGESMELAGYGHATDPQDKAAGKSTTYAMKYMLLYLFMTPTGNIDDSDLTHSNDIPVPKTEPINPVFNTTELQKHQKIISKYIADGESLPKIRKRLLSKYSEITEMAGNDLKKIVETVKS